MTGLLAGIATQQSSGSADSRAQNSQQATVGEFGVKLGTKRIRRSGRQALMITSITVFGPGVADAQVSVSCRSTSVGRPTPKLNPKVCARINAGQGRFRKRYTRRDKLVFSNLRWRIRATGDLEEGAHISIYVTKRGRTGRYLEIEDIGGYPEIQLAITGSGCLKSRARGLHGRTICPDVAAYRGTLGPHLPLREGESLQSRESMRQLSLRLESGGVLRMTSKCGPGVHGRNERTEFKTETDGNPGAVLEMEQNGNVALKAADGRTIWETQTGGNPGAFLMLHGGRFNVVTKRLDGPGLQVIDRLGKVLWSSPPSPPTPTACPLG